MQSPREKSVNIKDIFAILLKRKWLVISPIVIVTGLAFGATYLLTPEYRSSTIIWIDQPSNVSRELVQILGRENEGRESGEEQRRKIQALQNELTSQTYLHQLITELNLDDDPGITRTAAKMREERPSYSLDQLKMNILVDGLRSRIEVSFVGKDQIELAAKWSDPTMARDMVVSLARIMEQERTKYEIEKILDNQEFADLQLNKTEYHYEQMIDSLTAAQARMQSLSLPENIASEANRRDIVSDIDKTGISIDDNTTARNRLRNRLAELGLSNARLKYTDSIVELRTEIDGQVARFASLMERYAWNEQNVISVNVRLNDNLRRLEAAIERAVDDQFGSYPANQRDLIKEYFITEEHIDVLQSRKSQLEGSLTKIDERINRLPRLQAEIADLERKVSEARRYRDAFQSEETTVGILSERAKERTMYKTIEPARIPVEPEWPNRKKIVVLGIVLGFVLGGAAVFVAELMDTSVKKIEDIELLLDLPVLATIPRIDKLRSIRR